MILSERKEDKNIKTERSKYMLLAEDRSDDKLIDGGIDDRFHFLL